MSSSGEIVTIKVKYEYFTEKNEQKFSKNFEAKVNLAQDNFEENLVNINKTCNFRKPEDRYYYYMYDLDKNLFITHYKDFLELVKAKKVLVMRNCSAYSKHIIDRLREEEQRYKLGKNVNVNNSTVENNENNLEKTNTNKITEANTIKEENLKRKDTVTSSGEKNLNLMLTQFKKNLSCDIFAEEFISYEGIKYLVSFLENTTGNIRKLSLEALNKLLDYQSSNDYINKNDEIIVTLYEILMKGGDINSNKYAINILMTIISQDQAKAKYLLDVAEEYAKKSVTKIFSQIINFFRGNELELRTKTLILINVLLNFCEAERFPILEKQLKEAGIYEELEKMATIKDRDLQDQLTNFQMKTGKIISKSEYELQVYTKQMEDMERKCEKMEIKYEETIQDQIMYERVIEELIQIQQDLSKLKKMMRIFLMLKMVFLISLKYLKKIK